LVKAKKKIRLSNVSEKNADKMPQKIASLLHQGNLLSGAGHLNEALIFFRQALLLAPNVEQSYLKIAAILQRLGRTADLIDLCRKALDQGVTSGSVHNHLGAALYSSGRRQEALVSFRTAVTVNPRHGQSHYNLGMCLEDLGETQAALAAYTRAVQYMPENAPAHFGLARLSLGVGMMADWEKHIRKTLTLDPRNAQAHLQLALHKKKTTYEPQMEDMERLYHDPTISDRDREFLCFALGKSYEDLGEYSRAFEYFREGNRLHRTTHLCDQNHDQTVYARLMTLFSEDFYKIRADWRGATGGVRPIFILGMPRSGTTLVEQILASHPLVFGGGELYFLQEVIESVGGGPDQDDYYQVVSQMDIDAFTHLGRNYLEKLTATKGYCDEPCITDKMPHNFIDIGMIKMMLPEAKVVHCRRNPMDNCWSIFKNLFEGGLHCYAYDLTELGRYYVRYSQLMAHWRRTLPGYLHEISYEALVKNTESEIRKLLSFCDLEWDNRCLAFHRTKRDVQTASKSQVRQAIYRDSVRLWHNYQEFLSPLAESLGEVADKI
jgi:tetratricopeptide (TPR) repeat protein